MRRTFCFIVLLTAAIIHSCNDEVNSSVCKQHLKFPDGGFGYPAAITNGDSTLIFYQLKDSFDRRDSFIHAFFGYHFLRSFNEPNLSIRPSSKILFRISYEGFGVMPFVVSISCDNIILKRGVSGYLYPFEDTSRLSDTERLHYQFLEFRYPIDRSNISAKRRPYVDSLIELYPELLSSSYYRYIRDKSLSYDTMPFKYEKHEISLSKEKFNYFIQKINHSGFWEMPYEVNLIPTPTDGSGFIVEANTSNKFKVVISRNCPEESKKLVEVCQEIIDYANREKKEMSLCY